MFFCTSAISVGGLIFWLKIIFRERREEVEKRFRQQRIILQHNFAHFYGLQSIGHFQIRGNGILVMTTNELYFLLALPRRELKIPINSILSVSNPRSHLGKSNLCKLLRVDFSSGGKKDAVAWMIGRDFEVWTKVIEDAWKATKKRT
jgi:hypothetical protein